MPLPCCGEKKSKEQLEEEQYEKDLLKVFNKDQIYLDDKGNFRYGEKKFDPEYELNVIVDNDDQEEEEGKIWYVISSGWMNSWLLYAHLNRGINPNPGRIDNESLLDPNEDYTAWVPKPGLEMARKKHEGDYRRISEAAWKSFCEFYPGSGPTIKMEFVPDENHASDGLYDCSGWQIDQSMFDELMEPQKKKKSLFSFMKKKKKKNKEGEGEENDDDENEGNEAQEDVTSQEGMELSGMKKTDMKEFFGKSTMKDSETREAEEKERESSAWLFE